MFWRVWWISRCFGEFGGFLGVLVSLVDFYVFWWFSTCFAGVSRFLGVLVGLVGF